MYHKVNRLAYLAKLKAVTDFDGQPINFLPVEFHDPTLDFDTRLKAYVTKEAKPQELNNNKWIGVLWRRSAILPSQILTQYKKGQFVIFNGNDAAPEYKVYRYRVGSVNMEFMLYSNNPDYLEDLEELLLLDLPFNFPIDVNYPKLNQVIPMRTSITNHVAGAVTKDPRENYGSLVKMQINCSFNYVIPKFESNIKGTKEITLDIKANTKQGTDFIEADFVLTAAE